MTIHIKPSQRGSLHRHLGIPQGDKIPASKLSIKSTDSSAIKKKKQFAINARKWKHGDGGTIRVNPETELMIQNSKIKYAFGGTVKPTVSGGDVATTGLSTASGAIGGAVTASLLTGTTLGATLGPIGMGAGALIGGGIGLVKGLFGARGRSKQRAALKEQNRQQTIANMDQLNDANTAEYSGRNTANTPVSFYMNGGRIFANGGTMNPNGNAQPGVVPVSHDTQFAVGASHENGGVPIDANNEVEGGETMKQQSRETIVFSDRLALPGSNITFADASKPLMLFKGKLEKRFASNEKDIDVQRKIINKPTSTQLVSGTAKRRAMISSQKSDKILAQIGMIDSQLDNLFKTQEQMKGDVEQPTSNVGPQQFRLGGEFNSDYNPNLKTRFDNMLGSNDIKDRFKNNLPVEFNSYYNPAIKNKINMASIGASKGVDASTIAPKGFNQIAMQAGADVLDTINASIISNQMSNLPLPTKRLTRTPRFNTYVDNSKDISAIDANMSEGMKFIKDNVSNPAIRRATMMNLMNQSAKSKSSSFFNKMAMERELENKNVQLAFDTGRENADIAYNNSLMQYQSNMAGLTRQNQIMSNFADSIANLGVSKATKEANDIGFLSILSQFPEGVRKSILQNIKQGTSKGSAVAKAYGI